MQQYLCPNCDAERVYMQACECGCIVTAPPSSIEEVADINRRLKSPGLIALTEDQFIAMIAFMEWRQDGSQLDGAVDDAIRVVEEVKRRQVELKQEMEEDERREAELDRLFRDEPDDA